MQWDGYVVHPSEWDDDFLRFNYLGAPWKDGSVGNGGFSLRSRRLLTALQDERAVVFGQEDVAICGVLRAPLEREYGIRFGSTDVADRFSFEMRREHILAGAKTFGFHGLSNLAHVESDAEIAAIARTLSNEYVKSDMCNRLLRNCIVFNKPLAAATLKQRITLSDQ